MGVRVQDLRVPAQNLAEEITKGGITMVDLVSIGILFLDGKDAIDISELRRLINDPESAKYRPKEIVRRALTRAKAQKQKSA